VFSVVVVKTLDISQGSAATHLRCGGIFYDSIITRYMKYKNFFFASRSQWHKAAA